jgi:glycosyltransferase involved in cell wall biosynthesis
MVSVCLAAYNGEKYIVDQVNSILRELEGIDEVIVCDDASTDASYSVVQSIDDSRIVLLRNKKNIGHVKNFEKLLSIAKGDFIFLSDQDDIWVEGKVRKVLQAFQGNNDILLVYHNIKTINSFGNELQNVFPKYSAGTRNSLIFLLRQIIKPQIFGCACCIRRKKIDRLLPFPKSVYAHDHWIAIWAAINGSVFFLHDILVKHRKHDSNLTPDRHLSIKAIIVSRYKLFIQIVELAYRRFLSLR